MTAPQPNIPDAAQLAANLATELAAWSAIAQAELISLGQSRELLKQVLAGLPRRHPACRMVARQCRSYRRARRTSVTLIAMLDLRLAHLRSDEPLPF